MRMTYQKNTTMRAKMPKKDVEIGVHSDDYPWAHSDQKSVSLVYLSNRTVSWLILTHKFTQEDIYSQRTQNW